jgi:hypothetical protein
LTDEKPARKHFEHDHEACARDSRQDFAKALESTKLPESLKYAQFDFLTNIRQNMNEERGRAPNFLTSPILHDLFSNNLRVFASNLRRLDLRLMADSSTFWSDHGSVSWPNLEYLSVMFHIATPPGSWYFSGMPEETADDMFPPIESNTSDDLWWHKRENLHRTNLHDEKFRVVPREDTLYPFLAAFSKSASNMHAL